MLNGTIELLLKHQAVVFAVIGTFVALVTATLLRALSFSKGGEGKVTLKFEIKSLNPKVTASEAIVQAEALSSGLQEALAAKFPGSAVQLRRVEGVPSDRDVQELLMQIERSKVKQNAQAAIANFASTEFLNIMKTELRNVFVKRVATPARTTGAKSRTLRWIGVGILLLGSGAAFGTWYGRKDPVAGTTVLGMPPLTCDHHSHSLVLFIHGWRGDREDTWKRFPELVCGDFDFRDYDVLSIGYPVYLIGSNLTMEQFGGWLADKLAANNMQRYRKIAIVAHSIGGLLARQIVLEQRPELKNIVLLVEIGTPHLGPYGYTALANSIDLPGGHLVGELQAGSPYLQNLQSGWDNLGERPHTFCEGSPRDNVVSLESAQDTCDEKHAYPSLDHRELVKPTDIREDRYKIPMYTVKKYLG
jgi:pimeloyl-ACP methyl ester carboxylesterase